ncbi:eukaryotic translation initiation factor 2D [Colias croceus]|uniref:eukaryotic translation initiation factor 2D n=1 Tax=Colias crocea TaxID=72248 RepID=UPI001E27B655|nr:eukaryotic translation initiation factor 2D [Colias croceus]
MFAKPYKLKSNNTLKNSEKKNLIQRIQKKYPSAPEERIKEIVPNKSTSSLMKLVLHSGDTVGVYVVDGVPMIIEVEELLVPTVCALWIVPDLVPTIVIHSPVLNKVQGGAPLYAPGVVTTDAAHFPRFSKGALLSACTIDNAAAGIVGRATMSSGDMLIAPMGVCLEVLHVYGDLLCKDLKFNKIERPKMQHSVLNIVDNITNEIGQLNIHPVKEEWPSLVRETVPQANEPKVIEEPPDSNTEVVEEQLDDTVATECSDSDEDRIPDDMDGLLRWCLLSFLKLHAKDIELPLKTNLLYKNYLMPLCPSDRTLDVKKSTFKKMGKFLEAMQREGLLEVKEIDKGVDAVVRIVPSHPAVRAHTAVKPSPPKSVSDEAPAPPVVRELYSITANVADLFTPLKKGTALAANEIRKTIKEYVTARQLEAGRGCIKLDATLAKATGKKEQELIKWEEVMSLTLSRMTASTELRYADGAARLVRARLPPVQMSVVTRSGNKKVTLVSNLETYGFILSQLATECQRGVAASCGVTRAPSATQDQLMLQGDQTHFVAKLLIEKYGLPKKYLEGADKALNKKK